MDLGPILDLLEQFNRSGWPVLETVPIGFADRSSKKIGSIPMGVPGLGIPN
jgi:hypothetical protein